MNRYPEHHPLAPVELAADLCCSGELVGRAGLRQVLSQFGLHADATQENTLLELIRESHCRKQHVVVY
jgi:hypothetical protein